MQLDTLTWLSTCKPCKGQLYATSLGSLCNGNVLQDESHRRNLKKDTTVNKFLLSPGWHAHRTNVLSLNQTCWKGFLGATTGIQESGYPEGAQRLLSPAAAASSKGTTRECGHRSLDAFYERRGHGNPTTQCLHWHAHKLLQPLYSWTPTEHTTNGTLPLCHHVSCDDFHRKPTSSFPTKHLPELGTCMRAKTKPLFTRPSIPFRQQTSETNGKRSLCLYLCAYKNSICVLAYVYVLFVYTSSVSS